ncbi:MAG: ATP-grasp domain-containing protein [Actinobacteria bacterium]|nr:ATP-grasp domain-containing protein [Actinomycetota bacterium]
MRLLVVGGKLQGTEAVYLAAKAGWETILVDRREAPPAAGLADRHVVTDIVADDARAKALVTVCDAVLPACEDTSTLEWLTERVPAWGVPLLFDLDAYRVSASKLASQRLFAELDVPRPLTWPSCGFPAVVKPDSASGSEGVSVVANEAEFTAALARLEAGGHEPVIEEYIAGPSLSLEVLAWGGYAVPLQVTGLEFDVAFDCKRVVAPVGEAGAGGPATAGPDGSLAWDGAVAPGTLAAFDATALRLAAGLGLNGLMDVEVMVGGAQPKVLEIDARLPSQTPTAVYWSCGLNIVELLHETARSGAPPAVDRRPRRACVYQHVHAHDSLLEVAGEHVMGSAAPLRLVGGFFGADEALTDYRRGARSWAATLIATGADVVTARRRADEAAKELARYERLELVLEPDGPAGTEATRS